MYVHSYNGDDISHEVVGFSGTVSDVLNMSGTLMTSTLLAFWRSFIHFWLLMRYTMPLSYTTLIWRPSKNRSGTLDVRALLKLMNTDLLTGALRYVPACKLSHKTMTI